MISGPLISLQRNQDMNNHIQLRAPLAGVLLWLLLISLFLFAPEASWAYPTSLAGYWQFQLDPTDVGERQQWFSRQLPDAIKLPGILQSQFFGDELSTKTPWMLTLYDRSWFLREDYKAYTERGNFKVPFLSQPPRHYLGAAWYQ